MTQDILQYASTIWNTADLLRGCGIKESEWPSYMMPFFALVMIESRLLRMLDELIAEHGAEFLTDLDQDDLFVLAKGEKQGYNRLIFERRITLQEVCRNDKSFEVDFTAYLRAFDDETRDLLGVDADGGEKFLDIHGIITKLKAKGVLFSYTAEWSRVDLKPFDNSAITTLEEHIKRQWADISAETAGEQYTPDDVISLIAEIIASKIEDSDTLLKIYDCTCGGGNLLFGVEDRINAKSKRLTQTFGQDWNDALYALARIEGRFRLDSKIAHGNTLTNDQFYNDTFDVVTANPPYGVSWKGYQKDILRDKTGRFTYIPSVADGQLLFMQHLIAKLAPTGMGVVVHNGSTLFSGDAGSAESNIRKWMLDTDIVEAIIQLPTDEFFNTGIYTYLWVLNKAKDPARKDKVMLINASEKFQPLKKSKGAKRKAVDPQSRQEIVEALTAFQDNAFARVFDKEFFYFNKQALRLTNVDADGRSFAAQLKEGQKQRKLKPVRLTDGAPSGVHTWTEFEITASPVAGISLYDYYNDTLKPQIAALDYKAPSFVVETATARFTYDAERDTLIQERKRPKGLVRESLALGCGKIEVKAAYKSATKTQPARIDITVALAADEEKDYEIIPYHSDPTANDQAIAGFMARYITRPFVLLDNVVGVEINFNKVFYQPEKLRPVAAILDDSVQIDFELKVLEEAQLLINRAVTHGLDPDAPMKDSGIDWIGEIPVHWEIERAKALFRKVSRPISDSDDIVTAFRDGEVTLRKNRRTEGFTNALKEIGYQGIRTGDLVIHAMDAFAGAIGVSDSNGKSSPVYSVYIAIDSKRVFIPYYGLLLRQMALSGFISSLAKGIRQRSTDFRHNQFAPLELPVPPLPEQRAITAYLDERTAHIDRIIAAINAKIAALRELRQTLINDVVTGKIKVCDA